MMKCSGHTLRLIQLGEDYCWKQLVSFVNNDPNMRAELQFYGADTSILQVT